MPTDSTDDLGETLLVALRNAPGGLSEHELFKILANGGDERFEDSVFQQPLALYRAHFVLFHHLYRLQQRLCREGLGQLRISPLCIRLREDAMPAGTALDEPDPLRAYYLDLDNLTDTTGDDVDQMLGRFWAGLTNDQRRQEALAVLGLNDPVEDQQIKRTYRRLAMAHHPDRGGDTARLQALNAAMAVLSPDRKR